MKRSLSSREVRADHSQLGPDAAMCIYHRELRLISRKRLRVLLQLTPEAIGVFNRSSSFT
jgi:hypothetical protein